MARKAIVIMLVFSLLFLNSCGGRAVIFDDDDQKAAARLEQAIKAIENHDKDALMAMFSKQALDEAEDLDGRMDYLFEFVKGDITSWKQIGGGMDGKNDHGHVVKKTRYWYTVKTDQEDYMFFLLEYPLNTDHPENVGLYMLQVIKAEDRDTQFDGGQDILCAGIYPPPASTSSAIN